MALPLDRVRLRAPATDEAIAEFERASGLRLPEDYSAFLRTTNGGEGSIGESWVRFWGVEELLEMNAAYDIPKYFPELFVFGTNGGGTAFAFDIRCAPWTVVEIDLISIDLQDSIAAGNTFTDFLDRLLRFRIAEFIADWRSRRPQDETAIAKFETTIEDIDRGNVRLMMIHGFDTRGCRDRLQIGGVFHRDTLAAALDNLRGDKPSLKELQGKNGCNLLLGIGRDYGCAEFRGRDKIDTFFAAVGDGSQNQSIELAFEGRIGRFLIPAAYLLPFDTVSRVALHFFDTLRRSDIVEWKQVPHTIFVGID